MRMLLRWQNWEKRHLNKMDSKLRKAKSKAGKLLSQHLREIAEEETETVKDPDGVDIMATKAEALARKIWQMALGYIETQIRDGKRSEIHHLPDRGMMGMILDRMEGRAPMIAAEGAGKMTAADKVSEQGAKRIAKAGKLENATSD